MNQLSPAAQVMIAVTHVYQEHGGDPPARAVAAAALRAAADQLLPVCSTQTDRGMQRMAIRNDLLVIAEELEAQ